MKLKHILSLILILIILSSSLLNAQADQLNNALCKFDNLRFEYGPAADFYAIENIHLQEKIKLNSNDSINQEMTRVLSKFLEEKNIQKFYGTIVLDENDRIMFAESYQNEMYNHYQTIDSLSISQRILKERAHLNISDETLRSIYAILEKAKWETGKCYGQRVNSYFLFHIENNRYKKPLNNKQ